MAIELEVMIKDDERRLKRDFLIYEPFMLSDTDPTISNCVKEALDEFKGEADDIKVKVTMVIK